MLTRSPLRGAVDVEKGTERGVGGGGVLNSQLCMGVGKPNSKAVEGSRGKGC